MRSIYFLALYFLLPFSEVQKVETAFNGFKKIKKDVLKIAQKKNIPAFNLLIQQGKEKFELNYHHPKLKDQSVYGIGSTTKLLATTLIFKLIEEGELILNDPVSKYIDFLPNEYIANITIKQLLNHTSGLADYTQNPQWIQKVINGQAPKTFAEKLAFINTEQNHTNTFSYSNTNYVFLEEIVSKITKQSFKEAFNNFYKNLGFETIQIGETPENTIAFFAQDEKKSSDVSQWREHYGFDGGAFATTEEMNLFLHKMFVEKSILQQSSLHTMQTWISMQPMEIPIGKAGKIAAYGYGIMKLTYKNETYIGHSGGTLKYQSFLFYNEANNTAISFTTNCSGLHYNNVFFQEMIPVILDRL
ncbi:MAG: serine hydrolase domain-containing protein [Kordia sp.]|uniref:serine hydrolase domain-containing protein n=1 Tax=Kordia sp. TaxID=1965332 RepID=UPI00385E6C56